MATLRLIGYWRNEAHPEYPDPSAWVDNSWDDDQRHQVWFYFATGLLLRTVMGSSPCRICGTHNGSVEYTDGIYVWPEGLGHYISEHDVRLPQEVINHALTRVAALEDGEISDSWWLSAAPSIGA